jgi:integrase
VASIEKRRWKNGTSYRVVWYDPDATVKNNQSRRSLTFDTLKEAEKFKAILEQCGHRIREAHAVVSAIQQRVPTVAEVVAHHITHLTGIQQRTREDYERDARRHIVPYLGALPVNTVEPDHVRWWINQLDGTLSPKTIKNVHSILSSALNGCIPKWRADNPAKGIRLPQGSTSRATFLTRHEYHILVSHIPEYYRPVVQTLAMTGLRWGELVALQVGDVELMADVPYLRVTKALKRNRAGHFVGTPKSIRSKRTVSLPRSLVDILTPLVRHRHPDATLFVGPKGGQLRSRNFQERIWAPAIDEASAPYDPLGNPRPQEVRLNKRPRIHDLRHSHASWLIAANVDLATVQRRLGHESITTTVDLYGHLSPGQLEQAAAAADLGRTIPEIPDYVPESLLT